MSNLPAKYDSPQLPAGRPSNAIRKEINDRVAADGIVDHLVMIALGRVGEIKEDREGNRIYTECPVKEQVNAADKLLKYGIGTAKDVNIDVVKLKLAQTIGVITEFLTRDLAEPLLARIEPIWRD